MFNSYFCVILLALLLCQLLQLAADLLNLKSLHPAPPAGLADLYDPETYRRSQLYTRALTAFGIMRALFDLAVLLAFWLCGGFALAQEAAAGCGLGPVATGIIFLAGLFLARFLLRLPFAAYATFGIEARFGFNRTSPATFVKDRIKGLGLALLLGVPLLAALLWFFHHAGDQAWLWCWLTITLFSLCISFVAPTWIMPLFNRFTPLEAGELRTAILDYAAGVGFPVRNIFVIDGSRRSAKANAFFTGFGRNRRIALFDTLVKDHTPGELVAVVAHEIGHWRRGHILKGMIMGILHTGALLLLLSFFLRTPGLHSAFGMEEVTVHGGLVFFSLLYTPLELLLGVVTGIISRAHEFQADRFAATTIADPLDLVRGLKRLARKNLANLTPHGLYVFLNHSHPPLRQRIEAIENHVRQTQGS